MKNLMYCALAIACSTAAACKGKKTKESSSGSEKSAVESRRQDAKPVEVSCEQEKMLSDCSSWGCGSNSPRVGGEEFDLDGAKCNRKGFKIIRVDVNGVGIPGKPSIQSGRPPYEVHDLRVEGGQFTANGVPVDPTEKDWWFAIKNGNGQRTDILIKPGKAVSQWDEPDKKVPTYELKIKSTNEPLCEHPRRWRAPIKDKDLPEEAARKNTAALLIKGERYHPEAAKMIEQAATWFNIACAGTALAKMRLLGYDPEKATSDVNAREATLNMLTANYCGAGTWTEPNVPLKYTRIDGEAFEPPGGTPQEPVRMESYWTHEGAACFAHTRLYSDQAIPRPDGDNKASSPCISKGLDYKECEAAIKKACEKLPKCERPPDSWLWKTEAIAHPHLSKKR